MTTPHDTVPFTRVFLSCVSSEFKSYRLRLANQLGALRDAPFDVKVQEDFQQGGDTLLDLLADYIRDCDLVIHLVGEMAGAMPTAEHERTLLRHLGDADTDAAPRWSYTQWEYHLARRLGKRILVYIAAADAPRGFAMPPPQGVEGSLLQQSHLKRIHESGENYGTFSDSHGLVRDVIHDLGLEGRRVNNLPLRTIGTLFKGRDEFLETLRTTLSHSDFRGHKRIAAITSTAATVHGLGGVGKTRAAIEFAHKYGEEFTAVLFVRADSPENLASNLAALCGPLVLNLAEKGAQETDIQAAAALRWLDQHPGWFLILDNVDTEEAATEVESLLARLIGHGQVVITSRISRWSGAVERLELDVLAVDDAVEFLLERTASDRRKQPDDEARARTLAVTLGQLALALEQAGAMIAELTYTFAEYLTEWTSRHERVLTWFDERVMRYPMSVAVTWQTSFDQLNPPARRLLHLLAWFAPDPIPESLLSVPTPGILPPGSADLADPRDALAELKRYSLATREADAPRFAVHRLVQDVTRRSLDSDTDHKALIAALNWIDDAFVGNPQDVRTWPTLEPLAPHAHTCAQYADKAAIPIPTSRLFGALGTLYQYRARYSDAEPLKRRALAIDEASYGPEHPEVARDLNNLATLLQTTNRLTEAEPLMRRALAIDEASYGPVHPDVARDLNNLAQLLQATNRLTEAESLMRRALAIDEASYGPEHPNVARDLNNLAQLLKATNRLTEAEPLMRRALAIDEASYGPEHPEVARDVNNLAALLRATNRLTEAEPLMRRALAIDEASYGPEHPNVAIRLNNLAALLQATNRLTEAEPLMKRHLEIFIQFTRATGHPHPHLQAAVNNYGGLLMEMGRTREEAINALREMAPELFDA